MTSSVCIRKCMCAAFFAVERHHGRAVGVQRPWRTLCWGGLSNSSSLTTRCLVYMYVCPCVLPFHVRVHTAFAPITSPYRSRVILVIAAVPVADIARGRRAVGARVVAGVHQGHDKARDDAHNVDPVHALNLGRDRLRRLVRGGKSGCECAFKNVCVRARE